ncbi:MAG: hypothetical protein HKN33_03415 [Pyrinomonadaceae bacterium]|nr:hypothetical protein [Pyrinomonadaceae bacterium]
MFKAKLIALSLILGFVALIIGSSGNIAVVAEDDPLIKELANYQTWEKITEQPIETGVNVAPMG